MKKYARFEQGKVVELLATDGNIAEMFHASLDWRPVADDVLVGWVEFEGQIVPPDHYQVLRAPLYPPIADALDAQVKMASADPVVQAAGVAQWNNYINACFAVKLQVPKP